MEMAPVADEDILAAVVVAFGLADIRIASEWDGCRVDLVDVQIWTRSGHIMKDMRNWRKQNHMGSSVLQALVFKRFGHSQNDFGQRWVRSRWLPGLCAVLCHGCNDVAEGLFGICTESSKWKEKIRSIAANGVMSAVRCIKR